MADLDHNDLGWTFRNGRTVVPLLIALAACSYLLYDTLSGPAVTIPATTTAAEPAGNTELIENSDQTTNDNLSSTEEESDDASPPRRYLAAARLACTRLAAGEGAHFRHEVAGVSFVVPKGCKFAARQNRGVLTTTGGTAAIFVMVAPEEGSLNQVVDFINEELRQNITAMQVTVHARETTINRMSGINFCGTGVSDGESIRWSVDIVQARRPVVFLSIATEEGNAKHINTLKSFTRSTKRL